MPTIRAPDGGFILVWLFRISCICHVMSALVAKLQLIYFNFCVRVNYFHIITTIAPFMAMFIHTLRSLDNNLHKLGDLSHVQRVFGYY